MTRRNRTNIYNLKTKACALKVWIEPDGRIAFVIQESIYKAQEVYIIRIEIEEIIKIGLRKVKETGEV